MVERVDRVDKEPLKAVMEDDEPEIEWDKAEFEDMTGFGEPLLPGNEGSYEGSDWVVRLIDAAIILVIVAIGFLLLRGF